MVEYLKKNKWITLLCVSVVVYFFLQYISPLVAPLLVAMLFVTIFGPLLQKLQRVFRLNRQVGAVFLLIVFGLLLALLVWMLSVWIVGNLPVWFQNLQGLWQKLQESVRGVCDFGSRVLNVESDYMEEMILGHMQEGTARLEEKILPEIVSGSMKYVRGVLGAGAFLFLFVISTVFFAKDYDRIMNGLLERQECHILLDIICGLIRYLATFIKAQIIIMLIIGAICATVLGFSGIPDGVLWGIVAGVLDAFPFVGTGIVLVPLAIVQFIGGYYVKAVVCILLYVGCIFAREILEPKLIGKKMGIPPWVVLTALYAGVKLFGVAGIIKGPLGFILVQQTFLSLKKAGWWQHDEAAGKENATTGGEKI
jgi:sporulation integral membrane protein YtvI